MSKELQIEIKELKIADNYDLIAGFMQQLHKHEHMLFDKTAQWDDIEAKYMRHIIEMQAEFDGLCLVAYSGVTPAGFIFGYTVDQDDSRIEVYEGKELYVSDGFVAENFRRQGIYHRLNQRLEQYYIDKGILRITRYTHIQNTRMRQLLEEEGYFVTRLLYEKWVE